MRVLAAIAGLSAAISGVAAAILAGHAGALLSGHPVGAAIAAQPLVPVASVVLATAGLPWVLGVRTRVVVAGYLAYLGLAAVMLVPDVPPTYPRPFAAAVLAGAAIGILAIEIGVRAGVVVAARGTDGTPFGRLWFWPAAAIAAPYLVWNQGLAGRSFLVGGFAAIVGANPVAVWLGRGAGVEATTLVPVVVLGVVCFASVDATAYVSRDLDGSLYRRLVTVVSRGGASDSSSPTADSGSGNDPAPSTAEANGPMDDVARSRRATANSEAAIANGPSTRASAESAEASSDSAQASPDPARASTDLAQGGPDAGDASTPGAESSTATTDSCESPDELAPCQNCGSEHQNREPRFVVTSPACTVVLCPDCESARLADLRTFDECRGPGVQDAVDDDACAVCGVSGSTLEAHPVVPLDAGGHRHPNNVLPLCHSCHVAVEEHRLASSARRAN